jgi:hypothetical protein
MYLQPITIFYNSYIMTWPQVLPTDSNPSSCRCERAPLCQATDTTLTIQKVEAHIQKPHASRAWLGHPLKKSYKRSIFNPFNNIYIYTCDISLHDSDIWTVHWMYYVHYNPKPNQVYIK